MIWFMVMQVVSTLVELVRLGHQSESEKDLEILLLRRQLAIYERRQKRTLRLSRGEKLTLVVLATKLKAETGRTIRGMGGSDPDRETGHAFRLASAVGPSQVDLPSTSFWRQTANRPGDRASGGASGTRERLGY